MTELRNVISVPFLQAVRLGRVPGFSIRDKFGKNSDIDIASGFETIWNGGGIYTGFNATGGETIEVFSSSALDVGTLADSGTATGGTFTTLTGTGISGVSPGDVLINDTRKDHGIVVSSTSTVITVWYFLFSIPQAGDQWRVVTQGSTGVPVLRLSNMLDGNYDNETAEYVILNGITPVDTVGQYIRCSRGRAHGGVQAGSITARQNVTTANVYMVMPEANGNTSMVAADTVPRGFTWFLVSWFVGLAGKTQAVCNIRGRVGLVGDSPQTLIEGAVASSGTSLFNIDLPALKGPLPQMSDFSIEADTNLNNTAMSAEWTVLQIDNSVLFQ